MNSKKRPLVKSKNTKPKKLTANVPSPQPNLAIDYNESKQVEVALRISEERYRPLVENANEAIFVAQDGMLKFVNPMASDLTGYSEKELTSIPFPNFIHPDDRDMVVERHLSRLKGDIIQPKYPFRLKPRDGSTKWVEINAVLIDWEGKPATLNFLSDITERKQVEEALRESEKHYRSLFENMLEGFSYCQMLFEHNKPYDFIYLDVNPAFEDLTGLRNVVGKKVSDVIPGIQESNPELFEVYSKVALTGKPERFETYIESMRIWLSISVYSTRKEYFVAVFDNITERKRVEEALQESQNILQTVLDSIPSAVFWKDRDSIYLGGNRTWLEVVGLKSTEEIVGKSDYDLPWKKKQADSFREYDRKVMGSGIPEYDIIEPFSRVDGTQAWAKTNKVPLRDTEGNVVGVLGTYEDITERKHMEEDLKESEAKYRSLIEQAWDGIFVVDSIGKMVLVNQQACQMLGYTQEELIQLNVADTYPVEQRAHAIERIARTQKGEHLRYERMILRKDGTFFPVDVMIGMLPSGLTQGIVRDITERKRAEAQIAYQANLLAQVGDAIVASDEQYRLTAWNLAAEAMYGWKAEEVLGNDGIEICRTEWVNADPGEMRQMIAKTGHWHGEATQACKDGTRIPVEVSTLVLRGDSGQITGYVSVNRDITERKRAEKDIQSLAKFPSENPNPILRIGQDGTLLYMNVAGSSQLPDWHLQVGQAVPPMLKEAVVKSMKNGTIQMIDLEYGERIFSFTVAPIGATDYANLYGLDITERKRAEAELVKTHEQLRALTHYWQNTIEAERAHISHEIHDDFGQSMTALKMDLTWLANRLPEGDEKVDRIRGMTTLVDESIALMRRIATNLRPGLLDDLGLNAALEWQAQEFSRRSGIPCKLNLPEVDLDLDPALSTTLFRIFQETLTNITRHAQATRVSASLKQNKQILVLTIRDNGRGITEDELTNPSSLGLLGLRERATQWKGKATIRGAPGKGTTVTICIPLPAQTANGGKP